MIAYGQCLIDFVEDFVHTRLSHAIFVLRD